MSAQDITERLRAEIARLQAELDRTIATERYRMTAHTLKVAGDFAAWMSTEGAGPTYTTFCDDFGYQPKPGEDRPALYKRVTQVLSAAGFFLDDAQKGRANE